MRRALAVLAAALVTAGLVAAAASASASLKVGIYDEAQTLTAPNAEDGFDLLVELNAQVLRLNLYWDRVAVRRPRFPREPHDPAYDWSFYDRAVQLAAERGLDLVFSVFATPAWANGGKGANYAPAKTKDLESFAYAAAKRYSGRYVPPAPGPWSPEGEVLPRVSRWMAWNEPNSPNFLKPQTAKVAGRWVAVSPKTYAGICNAVYAGVHAAGKALKVKETVVCGATNPRGNNAYKGARPSISPLAFLRGMKEAGAKFDVYAHHPYTPAEDLVSPATPPKARTTVTMGNIDTLIAELDRLYGKGKHVWITEYGYQTNPPDQAFGVSWATQAAYLTQAFAIARANPRIDLMLWFLLRDEPDVGRWQSGLMDAEGNRKPSFAAFQALRVQ